jgi:hypothetical protein
MMMRRRRRTPRHHKLSLKMLERLEISQIRTLSHLLSLLQQRLQKAAC